MNRVHSMQRITSFGRTKASRAPDVPAQSEQPLILLQDIQKTFETPAGPFHALRDVNLSVDPGEFVAITGRSGSGKSTLINMLTGIDSPSDGELMVCGAPLNHLSENEMSIWRGQNLGIIFQFFQLLPTLTVLENVMLPMDFAGKFAARSRPERGMALLEHVGLADHSGKLPSALSGGQQQRAAIARALANDPALLVADEPTGNLDSSTAESVFQLFEHLVREGKTILMVTHDEKLARRTGRHIELLDGRILPENGYRPDASMATVDAAGARYA
jgi:putative ABC transport system ATP-binding protein